MPEGENPNPLFLTNQIYYRSIDVFSSHHRWNEPLIMPTTPFPLCPTLYHINKVRGSRPSPLRDERRPILHLLVDSPFMATWNIKWTLKCLASYDSCMARPPSGKPRKVRIALTFSPEILQEIRELATNEKESISTVAERLLTTGLTCPHCDKRIYHK